MLPLAPLPRLPCGLLRPSELHPAVSAAPSLNAAFSSLLFSWLPLVLLFVVVCLSYVLPFQLGRYVADRLHSLAGGLVAHFAITA